MYKDVSYQFLSVVDYLPLSLSHSAVYCIQTFQTHAAWPFKLTSTISNSYLQFNILHICYLIIYKQPLVFFPDMFTVMSYFFS